MLKKIASSGGAPFTICPAPASRGATWASDGNIYFVPNTASGIWKVSSNGGNPVELTRPDAARDENSHRWPQMLPDGKHLLITMKTPQITTFDAARIGIASIEDGTVETLFEGGTFARYLPSGQLIFGRGGTIYSVPFDAQKNKVLGPPAPVLDGVESDFTTGAVHLAFASNGSLVYVPKSRSAGSVLTLLDRQGHSEMMSTGDKELDEPRLSPDGRTVAARINAANDDIALFDIARGSVTRLTFEPGNEQWPVWSPDGSRIYYSSEVPHGAGTRIMWKRADGSGSSEELIRSTSLLQPTSISPDGKVLLYTEFSAPTGGDIWQLSLSDGKNTPFLSTPFNETDAVYSPDGLWVAYQSNESGKDEIYVRSLAAGGGKWQISIDGGFAPHWSHNEHELFFWKADRIYRAAISTTPAFSAGRPEEFVRFEQSSLFGLGTAEQYDITADDRVFVAQATGSQTAQFNFITNWFEDVQRRTLRPR